MREEAAVFHYSEGGREGGRWGLGKAAICNLHEHGNFDCPSVLNFECKCVQFVQVKVWRFRFLEEVVFDATLYYVGEDAQKPTTPSPSFVMHKITI